VYVRQHQTEEYRRADEQPGSKFGAKIITRKLDVSKYEDVNLWIEETVKDFGRLDGAANVAGIAGGDGDTTVATIVSHPSLNKLRIASKL
jgi:NAD(P)-dependent dehydrogenase (short-subunit alcohol dehydrogenase family)